VLIRRLTAKLLPELCRIEVHNTEIAVQYMLIRPTVSLWLLLALIFV